MELIDDQIFHWNKRLLYGSPVKVILYHPCLIVLPIRWGISPPALPCNRLGIGIQKILVAVKNDPFFWFIRSVYPICILKLFDIQLEYDHGIHISNAIVLRKGQNSKGLRLLSVKQKQLNPCSPVRMNGKIHSAWNGSGSKGLIKSRPDRKPVQIIHGNQMDSPGKA